MAQRPLAPTLLTQLLHTSFFCPSRAPAQHQPSVVPLSLSAAGVWEPSQAQAKGCPLALHSVSQGPSQSVSPTLGTCPWPQQCGICSLTEELRSRGEGSGFASPVLFATLSEGYWGSEVTT